MGIVKFFSLHPKRWAIIRKELLASAINVLVVVPKGYKQLCSNRARNVQRNGAGTAQFVG
jgi:hypothetical protein